MTSDNAQRESEVLRALRQVLPPERVDTSALALSKARRDESGFSSSQDPLCVAFVESTEQVSAVLSLAQRFDIPVVARGAGTGLTGASMGTAGEIVLSLARMDRVLEIDTANHVARVEAGVINGDFNSSLLAHGFWFAPDPASRDISSIGGNIATNAGGLMCAKYGVTREAVLGLTVVLADGSVITPGRRTAKGVTGLDVTGLFVGSEGILGVITEATVRILPVPHGQTVTLSAYFDDVHAAALCASEIGRRGLNPLIMELMDSACLGAVHAHLGLTAPPLRSAHLLVQFQDSAPSVTAAVTQKICAEHGALSVSVADGDDAEQLLVIRRSVHPALAALGTTLIEDVCVPRSELAAMFAVIDEVSRSYDLFIPTVSHAGDGNLHPNFVFEGPDVPDTVWTAANEIFTAALALGGTLTGEHGVGVLKKRWLRDELGEREYELQREIKRIFDPRNILNPGKVF